MAGMYIAMGYYGYLLVAGGLSSTSFKILGILLGAAVFPIGLVLIVITGVDLFTGNCLLFFGYLNKSFRFRVMLKNLVIVFIGNFIGALFFVALIYFSNIAGAETKNFIVGVVVNKTKLSFVQGLTRGILCNISVAIAVYLSFSAKSVVGKVVACHLPVFLFVLCGYEHVVANMFIMPLGAIFQTGGSITLKGAIGNFISVTLGNFIGGALVLTIPYYFIYVKEYNKKKL